MGDRRLLAVLACAGALAAGGCGAEEHASAPLRPAESSWVPGQGSLLLSPAYLAIAGPAEAGGEQRYAAYERGLSLIAARKAAAKKAAREAALRRYREERARALAKYRAALRKAARERERARRLAEKRRREAERRLRELLKKLRVPAGQECALPEVAQQFDCVSGRLPLGKPKKK